MKFNMSNSSLRPCSSKLLVNIVTAQQNIISRTNIGSSNNHLNMIPILALLLFPAPLHPELLPQILLLMLLNHLQDHHFHLPHPILILLIYPDQVLVILKIVIMVIHSLHLYYTFHLVVGHIKSQSRFTLLG